MGKVLRATHALWLHRNDLLHASTAEGIKGLDMVQLREAVETQFKTGRVGLDSKDWALLDIHIEDLMVDSIENIRGWLCNILIARGDIDAAGEEGLKDSTVVASQTVTAQQCKEFLDWRKVCLR